MVVAQVFIIVDNVVISLGVNPPPIDAKLHLLLEYDNGLPLSFDAPIKKSNGIVPFVVVVPLWLNEPFLYIYAFVSVSLDDTKYPVVPVFVAIPFIPVNPV
jgi:hypothetical protein